MADQLLFRGGSTSSVANSTVNSREIVIDTEREEIILGSSKKRTIMNGDAITVNVDEKVGVGTTVATARLDVREDGLDQPIQVWKSNIGTAGTRSMRVLSPSIDDSAAPFAFQTNNAISFEIDENEIMRVHGSGRVGIGTTNPVTPLHVSPAAGENILFKSAGSGQRPTIELNRDGGTNFSISNNLGVFELLSDGVPVYTKRGDDHRWFNDSGDEHMRLVQDGDLGIGTDDPQGKLDVRTATGESVRFVSSGAGQQPTIQLRRDGAGIDYSISNNQGVFELQEDGTAFYTKRDNDHRWFNSDGNEEMRLDFQGSLFIGGVVATSPNITLSTGGNGTFVGNVSAANISAFKSDLSTAAASASTVTELKNAIVNALALL